MAADIRPPVRPPARPPRRRLWPRVVVAAVVLAVAAVAGMLGWVVATTAGGGWALRTALTMAGATGGVEGVQGTLLDGLSIDKLTVRHPSADVDGEQLRIEVAWRALWSRRLHIREVSAHRLRVNTRPSDEASEPLTSLRLPLEIDVDHLKVGALEIENDGTRLPVSLGDIDLRAVLSKQGHRVLLAGLRVAGPQAEASVRGQAQLGVDLPFPTSFELNLDGRQGDRPFSLRADGRGSLESLALTLRGDGAGVELDAQGQLALLEGFPLRGLQLRLRDIDPAAWVPGAPSANLDLTADLTTLPAQAGKPDGRAVLQGPFSIVNDEPAAIDKGGMPVARLAGRLSLPVETFDAVDIAALDIGLAGGGRIGGELAWRKSADPTDAAGRVSGTLNAVNVDASKLHGAAVPTRLSGPIAFTADAASQQVSATLTEKGRAVPLSLKFAARLADSVVTVSQADLAAGPAKAHATGELQLAEPRRFAADLRLDRFNPAQWAPGAGLPPASVSASAKVKGVLSPAPAGSAALAIGPASRWNGAPLGGRADLAFVGSRVSKLDAALTAGSGRLQANGAFGQPGDKLEFDLDAPQLEVWWPALKGHLQTRGTLADTIAAPALSLTLDAGGLQVPGGVSIGSVQGHVDIGNAAGPAGASRRSAAPGGFAAAPANIDLRIGQVDVAAAPQASMREAVIKLEGTVASHRGSIDAHFLPVGDQAAATFAAAFSGGWGQGASSKDAAGWRGQIERLDADRAPFGIALAGPVTVSYLPGATAPQWQWEVGAAEATLKLPGGQTGKLVHAGSRGGAQRWETRGSAEGLAWAPDMLAGAVAGAPLPADRLLVFDADWDMRFQGALQGTAHVRRRGGDLWIPGTPPVALGLRTIEATLQAAPVGLDGHSHVTAKAEIDGERFGRIQITGEAGVLARDGALGLDTARPAFADADVDMRDISWVSLFLGDAAEVGGKIAGKAHFEQAAGRWQASGALNGEGIRVVRLDDGVRLLDGTLKLTLDNDRIVLDSLRFPGIMRVTPRDSRVVKWIDTEGKDGHLEITADWRLSEASGHATIIADRFPAIQRTDRFVAGSGRVDMDLAPQKMRIAGLFEADAGWVNLGTEAPPSLSSDVYVSRSGDAARPKPLGIAVDVGAKLGNRFYLQGYGLDTGLTGDLRVVGTGSALRASGSVRTLGGRFDAYGQTLTVRRGVITFQGAIDDPLLDIVALRVGPQVEAGVQVSGTARRPRIALISQPEVSDVEKLSWLLLGRGPDDGGGGADASLLLGAATSLLGPSGGEPLSRQLGVDEIGVRSGNVGSTRGLLPERTVAGDSTTSNPQLSSQFFIVGKRLSDAVYVSFEQALSGRDGVVRLSYRLTRRLSVVGKGGTLNGLDLLYYVFFDD